MANTKEIRYLGIQLSRDSNMTTGKIYKLVIVGNHRGFNDET